MKEVINTVRAIIMFTLLLFVLIFCFQNRQEVDISFLKIHIQALPLFIALFGTLAAGLLIGFLGGLLSGTKSKRDALRAKDEEREAKSRPKPIDADTKPEV